MDDYVGRRVRVVRGFETGRDTFTVGDILVVTGHHRGRLEVRAEDGRFARRVDRALVELEAPADPAGGAA